MSPLDRPVGSGPTIESYSRLGADYDADANQQSMWVRIGDALMADLPIDQAWGSVIDIGCGTGTSLRALAGRLPPTATLVGIEPADGMRAVAAATTGPDRRITVRDGRFEHLPVDDQSIDFAFSLWAFHWAIDPARAVAELARILKPTGSADLIFVGRHNGGRFAEITGDVLAHHLSWEERVAAAEVMQPYDRPMLEGLFARFGDAVSIEESFPEAIASVDVHLAWQMRMESHFAALSGARRTAFDAELRQALAALETPQGVVYQGHVLRVRIDGRRRCDRVPPSVSASGPWIDAVEAVPTTARTARARDLVRAATAEVIGQPLTADDDGRGLRDLGLGSLDAVSLAQRVAQGLGRAVPNTVVFSHPTIARLAELLAPAEAETVARPTRAPPAAAPAYDTRSAAPSAPNTGPIAVIGLGCRFPGGATSPDRFWSLLAEGRDAITPTPPDRWRAEDLPDMGVDRPIPPFGGYVDDLRDFDARFFRIAPTEARAMDPQQRLVMEVGWEALEHACIAPDRLAGSLTGVWLGTAGVDQQLRFYTRQFVEPDIYSVVGSLGSVAAGRISYRLGLTGPAIAVDTACSSSLVALHQACQALRTGEVEMALAGGVNCLMTPAFLIGFAHGRMLAPDGRCKTFDARANGFVRAEGCGMVVLKRLEDAQADGDTIHAVIRGSATNQDGASSGMAAPNPVAQAAVIRAALARAQITPADIDIVEAHGTGTVLGDAVELQALDTVFSHDPDRHRPVHISSVKTYIGHTEAAAGIAGVIRTILSLKHGRLTPHLHFQTPNQAFDWDQSALAVAPAGRPWVRRDGDTKPRLAGVSSFGVNGTNAHLILAEPPAPPDGEAEAAEPAVDTGPAGRVLMLSAATETALQTTAAAWSDALADPPGAVPDICAGAATGRSQLPHRLAVTGTTAADIRTRIAAWLQDGDGEGIHAGPPALSRPRIVFAFPGQGCQYAQMGRVLYATQPVFADAVDAAVDALAPHMDVDPISLLFPDSLDGADRIHHTRYTQPAIFVIELALARLWQAWGITPDAVFGHSFGEYAAAVIAGVMSLEDAARLVAARGRLADELPSTGGMAAVAAGLDGLSDDLAAVSALGPVYLAADNGPNAVTLAGSQAALMALVDRVKSRDGKATSLDISHPFHSPMMAGMVPAFGAQAAEAALSPPSLTYVSSVTGRIETAAVTDPNYWARQVVDPVRFREGLAALGDLEGPTLVIECSPRPVLMPLVRPQCPDRLSWLPSLTAGDESDAVTAETLATLFAAGLPLDGVAIQGSRRWQRLALPTTPFERVRHWVDVPPPYGQTLPPAHSGIIGRPKRLADGTSVAEGLISAADQIWVHDHVVKGHVILPGAALVDALAQSAGTVGLSAVSLTAPATVPTGGALSLQGLAQSDGSVTLFGRGSQTDDWTQLAQAHAEGTPADDAPPHPSLEDFQAGCPEAVDFETLLAAERTRGIDLGPAFQPLIGLWRGEGRCLAHLQDPGIAPRRTALLDGAFQAILPMIATASSAMLPFSFDQLSLPNDPWPATLWCGAVRHPGTKDRFDLTLFGADGAVLGRIDGFLVRPATLAGPVVPTLTEVVWRSKGRFNRPTPDTFLPTPATVIEGLVRPKRSDVSLSLAPLLRRVGIAIAFRGLNQAAGPWGAEAPLTLQRHPLAQVCADVLIQEGVATTTPDGGLGLINGAPADADPHPLIEPLAQQTATAPLAAILKPVADGVSDILAGRTSGLEILFPGGDLEPLAAFYGCLAAIPDMPSLLRSAIARLADAAPPARRLRVLEVGGGTGTALEMIRPILTSYGCRYTFTDVGRGFVDRAASRFGYWRTFSAAVLDLEQDPTDQGFEAGSFDLILADNVLHATQDVLATLQRLRPLLAPGGHLMLVEQTLPQGWLDIVFGVTDQWHKRSDYQRRPNHLLLSDQGWRAVLTEAGFDGIAVDPADPDAVGASSVILARAGETSPPTTAAPDMADQTLIVSAGSAVADRLAVRWGGSTASGTVGAIGQTRIRWDDRLRAGRAPTRLVFIATAGGRDPAAGANDLLQTLQALPAPPAEIVIVTQGAVRVDLQDRIEGARDGGLWGFARALDAELPDTLVRRIDVDPRFTDTEAAAALADELMDPETAQADGRQETEVALRPHGRFVTRIAEVPPDWPDLASDQHWRVGLNEDHQVAFLPAHRPDPAPGQIEVAVNAIGIGVPDLLLAANTLPIGPRGFGLDVAGVVSRVGDGVTAFQPGDRVFGFAEWGLAQYALIPEDMLMATPDGVADEDLAAVASTWLTVRVALTGPAKLKPGDRVFVHSAAGAIGQVTLQLARAKGATVFGTAHPTKFGQLRRQGIAQPLDSREAAFGRQIQVLTDGRGVDIVLTALTGDATMMENLIALAPGGQLVELGKRGAWSEARVASVRPDVTVHPIDLSVFCKAHPKTVKKLLRELAVVMAKGALKAPRGPVFAGSALVDGFALLRSGLNKGKPIVVPPRSRPATSPLTLPAGSVTLITGGLGGLGLGMARRLVDRGSKTIVLVGRRKPTDAQTAAITALRADGAHVTVVEADIATDAGRSAALVAARALGPLGGIVHAAGTLRDRRHERLDLDDMAAVIDPKLAAAWDLHDRTASDPMHFFIVFGSLAGIAGNAGQVAHAVASVGLDALMQRRHAEGRPALALDLGRVSDVGAAAGETIGTLLSARGIGPMTSDIVFDAVERLLHEGRPQAALGAVDWAKLTAVPGLHNQSRFADIVSEAALTPTVAATAASSRPRQRPKAAVRAETATPAQTALATAADTVQGIVAACLRMPKSDVPLDTPLILLGMDSLMAVDLRGQLLHAHGFDLPLSEAISGITARAIAERMAKPDGSAG